MSKGRFASVFYGSNRASFSAFSWLSSTHAHRDPLTRASGLPWRKSRKIGRFGAELGWAYHFRQALVPGDDRGGEELDRSGARYFRLIGQNFHRSKVKKPQNARIYGFFADPQGLTSRICGLCRSTIDNQYLSKMIVEVKRCMADGS